MRLYLTVLRNELPPVKTVWPISQTQLKWTVSQLVDSINVAFPLESDHWGLEDYIVTLAGFECLHYHEIGTIFQHGDEIILRPLQTAEIRGRTISGRDQISAGGRHLLDGVAYGKPALKGPQRSTVHIPARKRKREKDGGDGKLEEPARKRTHTRSSAGAQNGVNIQGEDSDSDESADDDFAPEDDEDVGEDDDTDDNNDCDAGDDEVDSSSSSSDHTNDDDDDDSSSASTDDDESSTADTNDTSSRGGPDRDADTSDTSSVSSAESASSWNGIPPTPVKPQSVLKTKQDSVPPVAGIPHAGSSKTLNRNRRRRLKKRLDYLKLHGLLPEDATFEDVEKFDQASNRTQDDNLEQQVLDPEHPVANGAIVVIDDRDVSASHTSTDDEPPDVQSTRDVPADVHMTAATQPDVEPSKPQPRRSRLDIASSNRLVFGSLGFRAPRNEAEREALRQKLAAPRDMQAKTVSEKLRDIKQSRIEAIRAATASDLETDTANGQTNPDARSQDVEDDWSNKISLRAVECCDEHITELSAPPFPFKQRWDPQYNKKKKKKRKRGSSAQQLYPDDMQHDGDTPAEYNEVADPLNYDDVEQQDDVPTDDLPPLPDDVTTLPTLDSKDAQEEDVVAYKELVCSAETGYQPIWVVRTAQLQGKDAADSDTWTIKLAARDLPKVDYDEDGNKVYGKFDMPGPEDDGADAENGFRTLQWSELIEPRLLRRGDSS